MSYVEPIVELRCPCGGLMLPEEGRLIRGGIERALPDERGALPPAYSFERLLWARCERCGSITRERF